ncbi:MAG: serine hydrolase [Planctomycetota bacterium]
MRLGRDLLRVLLLRPRSERDGAGSARRQREWGPRAWGPRMWWPRCVGAAAFGVASCLAACAATPAADLDSRLRAACAGFDGQVGYYVHHLVTGESAAWQADEPFPTASLIKVPILVRIMERVELGELDYHAPLVYDKERLYPGEDLLAAFEPGSKIDVAKLCLLMLTLSDNSASLWLQELAGTGTAVNTWLAAHDFRRTRVNSRTPGREAQKELFGWGQTTPREMAELLLSVHEGRAGSAAACDEMQRALSRTYWDGEALSAVPPGVAVLSKQGAVSHARSEVFLVHAPSGPYVACVMTKNQKDTSWDHDNAGFRLLRELSRLLWQHFEPARPYTPPAGGRRFACVPKCPPRPAGCGQVG